MKCSPSLLLLFALNWSFAQVFPTTPKPLGSNINTVYDEGCPVLSPDGNTLYFVRNRHPQNIGPANSADIWIAHRGTDGGWRRAINAGAPINDRNANQVVNVSPSGNQLFILSRKKDRFSLWKIQRQGRSWGLVTPVPLPPGVAPRALHLSNDGRVLLFSAAGRETGNDLFYALREDNGAWTAPAGLGPAINSPADENQVFLAADGKTLYFSSNRKSDPRGFQWYVSRRQDQSWTNWTNPQPLGLRLGEAPDHTKCLAVLGSGEAILDQSIPATGRDLFLVKLPETLKPLPMALIRGRIRSYDPADGVRLTVKPLENDDALPQLEISPDGQYAFLIPQTADVGVHAEAEGWFAPSEYYDGGPQQLEELDDSRNLLAAAELDPLYWRREVEVQNLSMELRQLDGEISEINEQRALYRKKLQAAGIDPFAQTDPQLEALRHRYHTFVARDTLPPDGAAAQELKAKGAPREEKRELAEMKETYRKFFETETSPDLTPEDRFLWEDGVTGDLLSEAARELAPQMDAAEQALLREKTAELRSLITRGLNTTDRPGTGAPAAGDSLWQIKLDAEALTAIDSTGNEEWLRLKSDLKTAFRDELAYATKKEKESEMRSALEKKLQQQFEAEKKLTARGAPEPPEPPRPAPDTARADLQILEKDLEPVTVEPGEMIPLNNIFFEVNKAVLKPASEHELQRLLQFLNRYPEREVEIGAHTHGWMPHTQAMSLSKQRAAAVANYLILNGISPQRVTYRGYGKTLPLTTNDTEAGRRKNQRVEMKIIK